MIKRRYVLILAGVLFGAWTVHAQPPDWTFWQKKFLKRQGIGDSLPGPPSLRIKELDVTATLPDYPSVKVADYRGQSRERCLTCHDGIAEVSASHPREFGCTVCHGGNGQSVDREAAHATLIYDADAGTGRGNPSALKVVDQSCGLAFCHSGHARDDRNHIRRVKKSMMATMAGVISSVRYQWGGQNDRRARYGVRALEDQDGTIPRHRGALPRLNPLPFFSPRDLRQALEPDAPRQTGAISRHIVDRLLRQRCFQCHLDAPPPPGQYRSEGCAACHFSYEEDGRYRGHDPTISRTERGHPAYHQMTALPEQTTCLQCHKTFTAGAPLQTFAESRDRPTPPIPLFPGNGRVRRDVHMDRGFECIDCHSQSDIMGDGNLYSKAYEAVEIRCETCHGTAESYPTVAQITDPKDRVLRLSRHYKGTTPSVGDWMVVSSHNRKLTNVKVEQDKIVVLGKRSGRKYETPLVRHSRQVHSLPGHRQRLGCTACHAQWVPRCTGCHMTLNQSRSPGESGNDTAWNPFRYSMTPVTPALMVGPRGKIVPMLDPPERGVTALDERGQAIAVLSRTGESRGRYREWEYTNPHGYSGSNLAYALNPHSVGKARSCASCHLSPRTLGMGEGDLKLGRKPSGQNDEMRPLNRSDAVQRKSEFGPDAKITARGETLAGTSQPGARPFNQEEAHRILKVGNCIPCHDRYDDPIYRNMDKSYAFEAKVQHRKRRNKILRKR